MITSKELQYVDLWAKETPMPGYDYSIETLHYIKRCVESFNEKYKNREYSIIFSDGEEIELEIQAKNLCHLLGIDYNNIKGDYFASYRQEVFGSSKNSFTSYDLLELIIEHAEKVAELDNDPKNKVKAINYYKARIKCEIFDKLFDFSTFNYGAINCLGDNESLPYDRRKTLFVPSNEPICPYFMMHIKLDDEDGKVYIPTSAFAPKDPKAYFENQEVIIPTQVIITTEESLTKKAATAEEKIRLLTLYRSIISEFQIENKINIYGDYETLLSDMTRQLRIS